MIPSQQRLCDFREQSGTTPGREREEGYAGTEEYSSCSDGFPCSLYLGLAIPDLKENIVHIATARETINFIASMEINFDKCERV